MTRPDTLRIALAQINPIVGDIAGNLAKARAARATAAAGRADVVMFSELFLSAYPPEDLVLKPAFQEACRAACEAIAADTADGGPAVLIGLPGRRTASSITPWRCSMAAASRRRRFKVELPNYGVFDEKRVFAEGRDAGPLNGCAACGSACRSAKTSGAPEVVETLAETGAANPDVAERFAVRLARKPDKRMNVVVARVTESGLPLAYLNQVGGQDELVFDGASFVLNADGTLACATSGLARSARSDRVDEIRRGWRWREGARCEALRRRRARLITPASSA
ncbi:MAG: hypothetical protein P0Y66_17565 [Candidatus Kaistia colombiensis]|nr:MAG: hypothetical protein P0Y66_17565 [Kaistia sp.]